MIETINRKTLSILMRGQIPVREPENVKEAKIPAHQDYSKYKTQKEEFGNKGDGHSNDTREKQKPQPVHVEKKVGRNDPCPCGSGKKYKYCHGA